MSLKGNWTDKIDGIDDVLAEDINSMAQGIIGLEEEFDKAEQDISAIKENLGDIDTALDFIIAIQNSLIGGDE